MTNEITQEIARLQREGVDPLAIAISPALRGLLEDEFLRGFNSPELSESMETRQVKTLMGLECFVWDIPASFVVIGTRAHFESLKALYGNPSDTLGNTLLSTGILIRLRARSEPGLRHFLDLHRSGEISYTEALSRMVIYLNDKNAELQNLAENLLSRQMPPIIFGSTKPPTTAPPATPGNP